jgi:ABC-type molybdenum transport system ATPase subunit/photorepair protein PhrA
VLDEPSNFLDREALGGLAVAIKEWSGAVVRTSSLAICHFPIDFAIKGHHLSQP